MIGDGAAFFIEIIVIPFKPNDPETVGEECLPGKSVIERLTSKILLGYLLGGRVNVFPVLEKL